MLAIIMLQSELRARCSHHDCSKDRVPGGIRRNARQTNSTFFRQSRYTCRLLPSRRRFRFAYEPSDPQAGSMMAFVLRCIAPCILGAALAVHAADEKKTAEVLRAHSPDKKFAMRIICDPEHADADEIPGTAIHSAAIVTLPGKQEAAPLLSADGLEPLWN